MVLSRYIGARVKRQEDPRLIRGAAAYTDDLRMPGVLYMSVLRSPHSHARIKSIDMGPALEQPGVVRGFTGAEIKQVCGPVPVGMAVDPDRVPLRYALAMDRVRHVGDAVAALVATSRPAARDAVEYIRVEYEALPAVVAMERAIEPGSTTLHEELGSNIAYHSPVETGDVDKAFAEADGVVSGRFVNQRLIPMFMEPRATLAHYQPGSGTLTVWSSTQTPHKLRNSLASAFQIPENRVRVIAPDVGGGFGAKADTYGEDMLACAFSIKLGRPVKWTEERQENFVATIHGRDQIQFAEAAYTRDGKITALRIRILADMGAYLGLYTAGVPTLTSLVSAGTYDIRNFKCDTYGVFTNKTPTGPYRGAGRPEAAYCIERLVDLVASELNMDPSEVRQRNFISADSFPYATATGVVYDTGNYALSLDKTLRNADYGRLREEQRLLRSQGRLMGIGMSTTTEICGIGPSALLSGGGWESAQVRVERSGKVTVLTGVSPHGQGSETTFAQIVADELGIPMEDVVVLHGDTESVQEGIGTFGSRGVAVGGAALLKAVHKVKEKATQIAAHLMDADLDRVFFEAGSFQVEDVQEKSMTLAEVAQEAYNAAKLPPEIEPGLGATAFYEPTNCTFPFGTHLAVVDIDNVTGEIKLRRYLTVDDAGNIINPTIVEGQIHGGVAQGIGQALLEGVQYSEDGQLVTGNILDYALPTAEDLPFFEVDTTVTPTPVNPLGAKGIGEMGTIAATPTVVNAVVDALAHLGVTHIDMPVTSEKVWRILQEKGVVK